MRQVPHSVGVREARARLSELLRDVQQGREWTITIRGRAVARLARVRRRETVDEWVARLRREGRLIPAPPDARWPEPLPLAKGVGALALKWLREDRDAGW